LEVFVTDPVSAIYKRAAGALEAFAAESSATAYKQRSTK
jgi:hypothetical protein